MTTHPAGWAVIECQALGRRGSVGVVGVGRPVVLLPSLFALPKTYRATVEALARRFRVYVVGVPGSGNGERLRRPWPLEQYGRWVAEVLLQLGLTDVILIGHSHAGAVAVHVAAVCPDRVGRLVVVDAIGSAVPRVFGGLIDLCLEWRLVRRAWPDVARNLVRHPTTFLYQLAACFTVDVLSTACRLRVPTTVAWGGQDHTLPHSAGEKLAATISGATMFTCEAGSHDWIISHPEVFARIV